MYSRDFEDPFAGYLGMAFTTRSFLKNDVFSSFEDNPEKVVNYLVKKLDFDGDGVVSKKDFIKTAPDELFNQEFYSTVEGKHMNLVLYMRYPSPFC